MTLEKYSQDLKKFRDDRDWTKFHTPKNLTMALTAEVGELCEHLQWLNDEQVANIKNDPTLAKDINEELADVFSYVISIANSLDINILDEANKKLEKNIAKYPVEKAKGIATKYNKL
jgi:dCTP diphosphatase